jgi:RNA polymerase sigma-70 factor (ECF subfamily)
MRHCAAHPVPIRDPVKRSLAPDVERGMAESWAVDPDVRMLAMARPLDPTASAAGGETADVIIHAYEAYQRDIHNFLRASVRNPDAADDLTQETFIRLVREVRGGRTPDNVRAWLYTVAAHLVTSRARRAAVAERFKAILAIRGHAESPEDVTVHGEEQALLRRALARLPADGRTAVLLAAHGFAGAEIARVLGRTQGATRTLLCRSRIRLREHYLSEAGATDTVRGRRRRA